MVFIDIILGHLLADLISGIYHALTDHGYNIKSQVRLFQEHHEDPDELGIDLWPMVGGIPIMAIGLLGCHPAFWVVLGISISLVQVSHYYAHHEGNWFTRLLQYSRIWMSPDHHAEHHDGEFDKNYCVISGWNNWWLNWIVRGYSDV